MHSPFDDPSERAVKRTREDFELPETERQLKSKPRPEAIPEVRKPIQSQPVATNNKTGLIILIVLVGIGALLFLAYIVFSMIPH